MNIISPQNEGLLATCSVVETPDGLLEPATLAESTECCVDLCTDAQTDCEDYCEGSVECDDCRIEGRVCVEACLNPIANSHYPDYYSLCANGYGCLTDVGIDVECAKRHSNAILECCRYACIPMGNVGCEGCRYAEEIALRGGNPRVKSVAKKLSKGERKTKGKRSLDKWYIFLGVLLLMFVFVVFVVVRN